MRWSFALPRENQWEWACRAGSDKRFWWGDEEDTTGKRLNASDKTLKKVHPDWPRTIFNMDDGHAFPAPIGSYQPNSFGLHDMLGNVWEHCSNGYIEFLDGPDLDGLEPERVFPRKTKESFAVRGGGWSNTPADCRCATQERDTLHFCHSNLGFRVAIQIIEKTELDKAVEILEQADHWDLISLDPDSSLPGETKPHKLAYYLLEVLRGVRRFHDWRVLGEATASDVEQRKSLINALKKGIDEGYAEHHQVTPDGGIVVSYSGCFNPRHGIRAVHRGKIVEFVICFECGTLMIFFSDRKDHEFFYVSDSTRNKFNAARKDAKLPIVPRLDENKKPMEKK